MRILLVGVSISVASVSGIKSSKSSYDILCCTAMGMPSVWMLV